MSNLQEGENKKKKQNKLQKKAKRRDIKISHFL